MRTCSIFLAALPFGSFVAGGWAQAPLPGTEALTATGDLSVQMVRGMNMFLDRQVALAVSKRAELWHADYSSRMAYEKSVAANRARLIRMIGAINARVANPEMQYVSSVAVPAKVAETDRFTAYAVRWPVLEGVDGEGLLLEPKSPVLARIVAVPDADQVPELIAGLNGGGAPGLSYARRLAENGCEVIIPTLADRTDRFSNNPRIAATTSEPGREFIYRQAYVLGRHIIGLEVQKIRSALDWFSKQEGAGKVPLGAIGWGEGGLLAFYAAAVDPRIESVLVSGYFGQRERLYEEPIYRNIFGLLTEFGDAEIAALIVPRGVFIVTGPAPTVLPPTAATPAREVMATGRLEPVPLADVRSEVGRATKLAGPFAGSIRLLEAGSSPAGPITDEALLPFLQSFSRTLTALRGPGSAPADVRVGFNPTDRQGRQLRELERFLQRLIPLSAAHREDFLWKKVQPTTPEAWREAMRPYREKFWTEAIGRFPRPALPLHPRSRQIFDESTWTGYEVVLDVFPEVQAWGYFFLPKGLKPGERRPVVVVQHGGGGMPATVLTAQYGAFGRRLAERGFIVFAPHMLNGGHERLPGRPSTLVLQRKANPIGKTITSVSVAQQEAILDWLGAQPTVDPERIAFYGLSYGGKAAMRIPAILDRYAVSICSGDFNEWIWKTATTDYVNSNVFRGSFDVLEFGLAESFNYAEMAALIAPRPFMVERGHNDPVSVDEWVAFEYAKVKRLYDKLKIPEATEFEYFDGPHMIHGVGTFKFLHRVLRWPEPDLAVAR